MQRQPLRIARDDKKREPFKVAFTIKTLEAIKPPAKGRTWVYDVKSPGLAFCLTEKGARSFHFYKRVNGRPQRIKLGDFPNITVEQARKLAAENNWEIAQGIDPQEQKRAARLEWTLGQLFEHYLDTHAKVHKKTWEADVGQFKRYLAGWKTRKVGAINEETVRALHAKVGTHHGHYAANRVLSLLSAMFNVGRLPNPAKGVRKFKEQSRERFLQADELPRFFAALDGESNETIRDFVFISLFTGARRANTQAMRWEQLNLIAGTWGIPDTKAGTPLTVHLSGPALTILDRRLGEAKARAASEGRPLDEWVFPAHHGDSGHLTAPKAAWKAILRRAGIADLRLHDLRRTLGSWQAAGGASLLVIGKSLGHKNIATTAVYSRLNLDPVRLSVNAATVAMMKAAMHGKPEEQGGTAGDEDISTPS